MAILPGGAVRRSIGDENLLLRIEEQFYNVAQFQAAATAPRQLVIGGVITGAGSQNTPRILGDGGGFTSFANVAGRLVGQLVSAAARVTRHSGEVRAPLSQQFSAAGNIPATMYGRNLRTYTFLVPVRVTVVGTAQIEVGFVTSNGLLTMLGADPGCVWSSDPAVNAGRWLPRSRLVAAGAITNGPDSGVTTADWHQLGLRYTEHPTTPTIEWLLDGTPRHILSGDASMPAQMGPGTIDYNPGYGVNLPAGTTVQFGAAVFEIRNTGV